MEVEEVKQHEGIQQYYITKIEALQVYATKYIYLISFWLYRVFTTVYVKAPSWLSGLSINKMCGKSQLQTLARSALIVIK